MVSHSRPLMDLDQVPAEEDDGKNTVLCNQSKSSCDQYQDTSMEWLFREVLNDKWLHTGWYDVIVLPLLECQWAFEEGEVAVLSTPRLGAVKSNKTDVSSGANEEDSEPEISGWVAGTVRQYNPVDTHSPHGAVLHFYVGDSYDSKRLDTDHVLKKFQSKSIWYMTVLGSLATTQREYTALHAFRHLNSQQIPHFGIHVKEDEKDWTEGVTCDQPPIPQAPG